MYGMCNKILKSDYVELKNASCSGLGFNLFLLSLSDVCCKMGDQVVSFSSLTFSIMGTLELVILVIFKGWLSVQQGDSEHLSSVSWRDRSTPSTVSEKVLIRCLSLSIDFVRLLNTWESD